MFGYFDLLVHTDGVFVMRLQSGSGADAVYSLQFTSRRSDCPAGSTKPWTDCDYLPTGKVMASFQWWWRGDRRLRCRWRHAAELTALLYSPRAQFHAAPSSTWQPLKWTQDMWNVRLVSGFKWKKSAMNELQLQCHHQQQQQQTNKRWAQARGLGSGGGAIAQDLHR